jgi:hypothetical protein
VLPFESLPSYLHLLNRMEKKYGSGSYNLVGLLNQAGLSDRRLVYLVVWSVGLVLLALSVRRRSLTLAIGASLVLSPIVWLHYFVLLAIPLALRWPRFAAAWAIPLFYWLCPGAGAHERDIVIGLIIFAVVIAVSEFGGLARLGGTHSLVRRYANVTEDVIPVVRQAPSSSSV